MDSSAIVKIYADEAESDAIRQIENLVISGIARVEVISAISRKRRMGELTGAEARTLIAEFGFELADSSQRYFVVGVTDPIIELASEIVVSHDLRAYDSVQLASAIATRDADPNCTTFACFDARLAEAAGAEGFDLIGS